MKLPCWKNSQPGVLAKSGSPARSNFVATAFVPPPYEFSTTSA